MKVGGSSIRTLAVGGTCAGADQRGGVRSAPMQRCPGPFGLGGTAWPRPSPGLATWGWCSQDPACARGQETSLPTQGMDRCWTLPGNQGPVGQDPGALLPRGWHPTDNKLGPPHSHVSPGVYSYLDSICQGRAGGPSPRNPTGEPGPGPRGQRALAGSWRPVLWWGTLWLWESAN